MARATLRLYIRSPPTKATQRRCCRGRTGSYMAARCGRLLPCPPGLCPQGSCTGWRHRGRTFRCSTPSARRTRAARTWMAPTATSRLSKRDPASFMARLFTAEQMAMVSCSGIPSGTQESVEVIHDFSALNSAGQNWDGAGPDGRLALGPHGTLYSNTESGGANGNGVIYSLREDGRFEVLHTFSATNATTGANEDGAFPDEGLMAGRGQAHRNSHLRRQRQPRRLQQQRRHALRVDIGRLRLRAIRFSGEGK